MTSTSCYLRIRRRMLQPDRRTNIRLLLDSACVRFYFEIGWSELSIVRSHTLQSRLFESDIERS